MLFCNKFFSIFHKWNSKNKTSLYNNEDKIRQLEILLKEQREINTTLSNKIKLQQNDLNERFEENKQRDKKLEILIGELIKIKSLEEKLEITKKQDIEPKVIHNPEDGSYSCHLGDDVYFLYLDDISKNITFEDDEYIDLSDINTFHIDTLQNDSNNINVNASSDDDDNSDNFNTLETSDAEGIFLDADNKEFFDAVDIISNSNESLFLTGKAGTGKTTLLKYIKAQSNNNKNYIALAPTGVAAVNAGGETIHSFFQIGFSPYLPDDDRLSIENLKFKKEKLELIRKLDMIIIDEVSMVRCDILDAISKILKSIRKNNSPFGGVQMIFIGDLFQLSPIADSQFWDFLEEYYDTEFFFSSIEAKKLNYQYVELSKIYRQTDIDFIRLLNNVRENKINYSDLSLLNGKFINQSNDSLEGYITLSTHRRNVDSINISKLDKLKSKLYTFNATVTGVFPEKNIPTESTLCIKIGAQIILMKNNLPEYYNGSMGVIEKIEKEPVINDESSRNGDNQGEIIDDVIYVRLFSNNETVRITRSNWDNIKYVYNREKNRIEPEVIGTFTQFPIKLAWAMTIHKSQGLTFDKVIVDAGNAFAHGQTYVALSRCRTLDGLILKTKILPKSIIVDSKIVDFIDDIKNNALPSKG